jgi:hypothetical protein
MVVLHPNFVARHPKVLLEELWRWRMFWSAELELGFADGSQSRQEAALRMMGMADYRIVLLEQQITQAARIAAKHASAADFAPSVPLALSPS